MTSRIEDEQRGMFLSSGRDGGGGRTVIKPTVTMLFECEVSIRRQSKIVNKLFKR